MSTSQHRKPIATPTTIPKTTQPSCSQPSSAESELPAPRRPRSNPATPNAPTKNTYATASSSAAPSRRPCPANGRRGGFAGTRPRVHCRTIGQTRSRVSRTRARTPGGQVGRRSSDRRAVRRLLSRLAVSLRPAARRAHGAARPGALSREQRARLLLRPVRLPALRPVRSGGADGLAAASRPGPTCAAAPRGSCRRTGSAAPAASPCTRRSAITRSRRRRASCRSSRSSCRTTRCRRWGG